MASHLKGIVTVLIVLIVGIALAPVVNTFAAGAAANSTGSAVTLYNLLPVIWALIVLGIAVGAIYGSFKS